MEQIINKIQKTVGLMGFEEANVKINVDDNYKKISVLIDDDLIQSQVALPQKERPPPLRNRPQLLPQGARAINCRARPGSGAQSNH
jgi:hypothetical protein